MDTAPGLGQVFTILNTELHLDSVTLEQAVKYVVGAIGRLANTHPLILPCL